MHTCNQTSAVMYEKFQSVSVHVWQIDVSVCKSKLLLPKKKKTFPIADKMMYKLQYHSHKCKHNHTLVSIKLYEHVVHYKLSTGEVATNVHIAIL